MSEKSPISRRSFLEATGAGLVLLTAGSSATLANESDLRTHAKRRVAERTGADVDDLTVVNEAVASWSTLDERYYHAKVRNADEGSLHGALLDADGTEVDRETIDEREARAFRETYGKLTTELHEQVEAADTDDQFTVAVWLEDIDRAAARDAVDFNDRPKDADLKSDLTDEFISRTEALTEAFARSADAIPGVEVLRASVGAPVVDVRTTPDGLDALQADDRVSRIFERSTERHEPLDAASKTHRTDSQKNGDYNMSGYPVGHGEFAHPDTSASINIAGKHWDGGAGDHATVTSEGIASNDDSLPGSAHDADVYTADDFFNEDSSSGGTHDEKMQWMDDNNVTALTLSANLGSTDTRVMKDWDVELNQEVLNFFMNVFVAAGNDDSDGNETVNNPAKGFNQVACGNTQDKDDGDWSNDEIAGSSRYKDPQSKHATDGSDSDSDYPVDKPEVSGAAGSVETPSSDGSIGGGTSMATPGAAGVGALLSKFSDDHGTIDFSYYPEVAKPVLMASAINDNSSYVKQGAGNVVATAAEDVVANGWFESDLYDESNDVQTYEFYASSYDSNVRLAVNWFTDVTDANFSDRSEIQSDIDLDITVKDPSGNSVAWAFSYDSTFEWVTFEPPESGTYTLEVDKYRWDSSSSSKWLGIAWYRE